MNTQILNATQDFLSNQLGLAADTLSVFDGGNDTICGIAANDQGGNDVALVTGFEDTEEMQLVCIQQLSYERHENGDTTMDCRVYPCEVGDTTLNGYTGAFIDGEFIAINELDNHPRRGAVEMAIGGDIQAFHAILCVTQQSNHYSSRVKNRLVAFWNECRFETLTAEAHRHIEAMQRAIMHG